jgi:hypothetical protein
VDAADLTGQSFGRRENKSSTSTEFLQEGNAQLVRARKCANTFSKNRNAKIQAGNDLG